MSPEKHNFGLWEKIRRFVNGFSGLFRDNSVVFLSDPGDVGGEWPDTYETREAQRAKAGIALAAIELFRDTEAATNSDD